MSKTCTICNKGSKLFGTRKKLRAGKYNPTGKKRKYPNLQKFQVPEDTKHKNYKLFAGKKILACAKCIKTLAKGKSKIQNSRLKKGAVFSNPRSQ